MRKVLSLFVLLGWLLPAGSLNPPVDARWQAKVPALQNTTAGGVQLAMQQQPVAEPSDFQAQMDLLYPQDIDPPESCHVPRLAPLGQDVEMMLGPWGEPGPLLGLDQPAAWDGEVPWDGEGGRPNVMASTDLSVIALNTEELVAAWSDLNGKIKYATWGAGSGWIVGSQLGSESASGNPVLLSRGPTHWAVFARFGAKIKIIEWYMGSLGDWQTLPGIDDAVSDPVVITQDAGHMALFYKTAAGEVNFTEWKGAWLKQPVPLGAGALSPIVSELSAVSRNDNHAAVFGVDAGGRLWFRQRSLRNELDWSDTTWVKLLEGAEIAKPAVASRHANHIGVVVKDSSGQPYYTRWAWVSPPKVYLPLVMRAATGRQQVPLDNEAVLISSVVGSNPAGWSQPIPLGDANFASPMTLAPRGIDSLAVLGIEADGNLYEIVWTEDTGWGSWQPIAGSNMMTGQVVTVVMRRMGDLMLLGRYDGNRAWHKHYTSLDKPVTDQELSSPLAGLPRAQTLAFVNGRWVRVSVTRQASGTWRAEAREISTGITGYLDLVQHGDSGQASNRVAVAAADLDVDGSAEVVVATLQSNRSYIDISVLEISFPNATTLAISASPRYEWLDPIAGEDVNVAIGDLDGDQHQDDIVVGYRSGSTSMRFGIFQHTDGVLGSQGGTTEINHKDWCAGLVDCTVGQHDLEITIGRVVRETVAPLEREQLVVLEVSNVKKGGVAYAQDRILTRRLLTDTWALEPVAAECQLLDPVPSAIAGTPYAAALGTGDMGATGLANVVYTFGDRLAVITDASTVPCTYRSLSGLPDQERSLAVGDFDTDGRSEAAAGYRGATTAVDMIEMVEGEALRISARRTLNGGYTVLAGDTDNDTQLAELAGCKTFSEIRVVAVVNGPPRWYEAGQPIQISGGVYGRTKSSGGGTTDGTTHRYGGSLSVGYELEFNVPVTAIKISEVRGQLTEELMGSSGVESQTVWAQTREQGYEYQAASLGMVVYNSTEFTCYYYDVYPPAEPESKTRAMLCTPTGRVCAEDFKPLEDWHGATFKQSAGPSWVDVGHTSPRGVHTNDLEEPFNYSRTLPVDESRVMYTWDAFDPVKVSYSSIGGFTNYWRISDMEGGENADTHSFESNTTLSLGATFFGISLDLAGTYGYLHESSSVTSWEESLEMGGAVEKYQDPNRLCYDLVPFVYTARAQSAAGVVYDYLEMDCYVPDVYPCAREAEDEAQP